jgi:homoserine O-succinyltransferase/O-acetyltransferase
MPVIADSNQLRAQEGSSRCISIGLINNMPDSALEATERQFTSLLNSASDGMHVRLSRYMMPDVPRNETALRYLDSRYESVNDLWDRRLDGLIVTGREPLAANLIDEPYWKSFTTVVEWAQSNTHSTIWSCLAAHAAILHLDGIARVKRNEKLCGVFDCTRATDHRLMAVAPARFRLPHSRWNGVSEDQLASCGYSVLTRAGDAGVDTFIKEQKALFVFFQGHPEYEPDTLLREYRRDLGRYFKAEVGDYPSMPRSYFDSPMMDTLKALQERAAAGRNEALLLEISDVLGETTIANTWEPSAISVYKNWLDYICAQKEKNLRSKRVKAMNYGARVEWATLNRSDRGIV